VWRGQSDTARPDEWEDNRSSIEEQRQDKAFGELLLQREETCESRAHVNIRARLGWKRRISEKGKGVGKRRRKEKKKKGEKQGMMRSDGV